jgi:membrane associated rhomboid family serine protease
VYSLVAINVAVFAHEAAFRSPVALEHFVDAYALIPYDLTHGVQLARPAPPTLLTLVTAQFLHGSILHVFFNMLFLAVFGPEVEAATGTLRFLILYLICGVIGGLAQIAIGPGSHVPGIGASGAIAGILGAYVLRFPTNDVQTLVPVGCFPLFLRLPAYVVIGLWAAVQFVHGYGTLSHRVLSEQGGGTAYFAHIGGFLAGVFLIGAFARPQGRRYRYAD